jgi:hypothetical protein
MSLRGEESTGKGAGAPAAKRAGTLRADTHEIKKETSSHPSQTRGKSAAAGRAVADAERAGPSRRGRNSAGQRQGPAKASGHWQPSPGVGGPPRTHHASQGPNMQGIAPVPTACHRVVSALVLHAPLSMARPGPARPGPSRPVWVGDKGQGHGTRLRTETARPGILVGAPAARGVSGFGAGRALCRLGRGGGGGRGGRLGLVDSAKTPRRFWNQIRRRSPTFTAAHSTRCSMKHAGARRRASERWTRGRGQERMRD